MVNSTEMRVADLRHRGDRQQFSLAIAAFPCCHDLTVAGPVPRPEVFRNDDVRDWPDGFLGGEAKDANGAGIPEVDEAVAIGGNNGIRSGREQRIDDSRSTVIAVLVRRVQISLTVTSRGAFYKR